MGNIADDFSLVGEAEAAAPQSTGFTNFGKLHLSTRYFKWVDGKPVEIAADEYRALPFKNAEGKGAKGQEIIFALDVQEFKPELQFTYSRKVGVGSLDWNKTLKPSIEKLLGRGCMDPAKVGETLTRLQDTYVALADVPQANTKNNPNRSQYNVCKLVAVYPDRAACYAAYLERGNGTPTSAVASSNGSQAAAVPTGNGVSPYAAAMKKKYEKLLAAGKSQDEAVATIVDEYEESPKAVKTALGL